MGLPSPTNICRMGDHPWNSLTAISSCGHHLPFRTPHAIRLWQHDDMKTWWHDNMMTWQWQHDGMTWWHNLMTWQYDDMTTWWHDMIAWGQADMPTCQLDDVMVRRHDDMHLVLSLELERIYWAAILSWFINKDCKIVNESGQNRSSNLIFFLTVFLF
jgi:hypothetical protein